MLMIIFVREKGKVCGKFGAMHNENLGSLCRSLSIVKIRSYDGLEMLLRWKRQEAYT
jgi:hypothetical protein